MTLLKRAMTLAVGEGAARILGVFVYVIIARSLGVEEFGVFSFAASISLVALTVIDMGQNKHAGRLVARHGADITHVYLRMVLNKLVMGVLFALTTAAIMTALDMSRQAMLATLLLIGWATVLNSLESMRAILKALDRMATDSIINSLESCGRLVAVVVAALLGADVVGFGLAFLLEAMVASLVAFVIISRQLPLVPSAGEWVRSRSFLRASAAIGLVSVVTVGFYRIDQVFVLPLAGETASGLYGAAARVAFTGIVAAMLVNHAAFPRLAAAFDDAVEYRKQLLSALMLAGTAAAGVAVMLLVFAGPIITLLYGSSYADAVVLLRILALVVFFNAFSSVGINSANALHREKRVLPIVAVLLVLASIANLLFVPEHGAFASAWISVAGEALLALSVLTVSRDMFRSPRKDMADSTSSAVDRSAGRQVMGSE